MSWYYNQTSGPRNEMSQKESMNGPHQTEIGRFAADGTDGWTIFRNAGKSARSQDYGKVRIISNLIAKRQAEKMTAKNVSVCSRMAGNGSGNESSSNFFSGPAIELSSPTAASSSAKTPRMSNRKSNDATFDKPKVDLPFSRNDDLRQDRDDSVGDMNSSFRRSPHSHRDEERTDVDCRSLFRNSGKSHSCRLSRYALDEKELQRFEYDWSIFGGRSHSQDRGNGISISNLIAKRQAEKMAVETKNDVPKLFKEPRPDLPSSPAEAAPPPPLPQRQQEEQGRGDTNSHEDGDGYYSEESTRNLVAIEDACDTICSDHSLEGRRSPSSEPARHDTSAENPFELISWGETMSERGRGLAMIRGELDESHYSDFLNAGSDNEPSSNFSVPTIDISWATAASSTAKSPWKSNRNSATLKVDLPFARNDDVDDDRDDSMSDMSLQSYGEEERTDALVASLVKSARRAACPMSLPSGRAGSGATHASKPNFSGQTMSTPKLKMAERSDQTSEGFEYARAAIIVGRHGIALDGWRNIKRLQYTDDDDGTLGVHVRKPHVRPVPAEAEELPVGRRDGHADDAAVVPPPLAAVASSPAVVVPRRRRPAPSAPQAAEPQARTDAPRRDPAVAPPGRQEDVAGSAEDLDGTGVRPRVVVLQRQDESLLPPLSAACPLETPEPDVPLDRAAGQDVPAKERRPRHELTAAAGRRAVRVARVERRHLVARLME
ncbi:hypothetical protein THAOC_08314 [Thalassiosira oceanica]|uniref:Uncharacterized protein n=1 Tax=Thalassiosira oceanica TaxID=159749 RepID=K0TAA5_THAOC|nr:hypothetical protein THAOC_08314 [Thalassiosira oceanica]|eukprot:EJK70331.1 hypothetical protein THAOC_08314 [Thalassiosira oceanica]